MKLKISNGTYALIDSKDAHLKKYTWFINDRYIKRVLPRIAGKQQQIYLHHAIMGYPMDGKQIDHINGDTLDNRRENLRIVSQRENTKNKVCHRTGRKTSKYVGVHFHKRWKKYVASICIKGERKHLGYFKNEEEASEAYKSYEKAVAL